MLGFLVFHDAATNAPRRCVCGLFSRGPRNTPGWPDLVLIRAATAHRSGRIVFCELKAERGRLSDHQGDWLRAIELAGGETHVWKPSDLDDLVEVLRR